jgi:hypothetical protein
VKPVVVALLFGLALFVAAGVAGVRFAARGATSAVPVVIQPAEVPQPVAIVASLRAASATPPPPVPRPLRCLPRGR